MVRAIVALLILLMVAACASESADEPVVEEYSTPTEQERAELEQWLQEEEADRAARVPWTPQEKNATAEEYISVSAGANHVCAVRIDGTVDCWGGHDWGQATPPEGQFASVSAGNDHTCGVRIDGSAVCWGNNARAY